MCCVIFECWFDEDILINLNYFNDEKFHSIYIILMALFYLKLFMVQFFLFILFVLLLEGFLLMQMLNKLFNGRKKKKKKGKSILNS